jgi:hypothetical protein
MNWENELTVEGVNIIYDVFTRIVKNLHYFYLPSDYLNHCRGNEYYRNCTFLSKSNDGLPRLAMHIIDFELPEYREEWIGEAIDSLQSDLMQELKNAGIHGYVNIDTPKLLEPFWSNLLFDHKPVICFTAVFTIFNIIDIVGYKNFMKHEMNELTNMLGNL